MRNDSHEAKISLADQQLTDRLTKTLREQGEQLDGSIVEQLAARRERVLMSRKTHWPRYAMAVAASLLVVLLIPQLLPSDSGSATLVVDDGLYISVEPELLATMEMLAMFDGDVDVNYVN